RRSALGMATPHSADAGAALLDHVSQATPKRVDRRLLEKRGVYPAFLEATGEKDIHHEAEVEHEGAKKLIAEIEAAGPDDDYFDARVSVLSEMINHHVNEEEKRGGMFAKARDSEM